MTKEIRIRLDDKVHRDLKKRAAAAKRTLQSQVAIEIEQNGAKVPVEASSP